MTNSFKNAAAESVPSTGWTGDVEGQKQGFRNLWAALTFRQMREDMVAIALLETCMPGMRI